MSALEPLLVLQGHDTAIDQIRHRLDTIPTRAAIVDLERRLAELADAEKPVLDRRDELARSQKRLEDEVATLDAKISEEDARLYSGAVTAARELQDLQTELDALRRRQSDLETEILEVMDLTEPVEAHLTDLDERRRQVVAELATLGEELAASEARIQGELDAELDARSAAAEGIGDDLLATYDRLRRQLGGTAVARLTGATCGACHLSLPAVEIDRLKREAVDAPTCTECGALLVI